MNNEQQTMVSRQNIWLKLYVLGMNGLAGSIIILMVYFFGIRGLSLAHYAVMAFASIIGAMTWGIWPKRAIH